MPIRTLKGMREEREALWLRAAAINDAAKTAERDLTEQEKAEVDGIVGEAGQLAQLDAEIRREEAIEAVQVRMAAEMASRPQQPAEVQTKAIIVPATVRRVGRLRAYHGPTAIEDAYAMGQWFLAAICRNEASSLWCREHGIQIQMALSTGGAANVLVPDQMSNAIIVQREEYGTARRLCDVFPMASDHAIVPRRASGVTAYFVGDNTEITASDPGWDAVTLTAKKLAALTKYSSEIAEDAVVSIADRITDEIAYAFAVKEDQCLFIGDGTSTYGGMVGIKNALAAGSVYTAITANTAFSTLDLADFESMVGKLPRYPGIQPRWFISQAGWAASMMRLADAAGGNTTQNIMGGGGLSFLGYPVEIVQCMNATLTAQTSTAGIVHFGDLRMAALLGDRRGLTLSATSDRYFEYDQLAIKGTERFDVNVHGIGTASVAGPMISLTFPSS